MDGVHVKIAEAYKPPRKVCLPAAYNNKLPDVSKLTYDFSLERSVLEKMTEWRNVREANSKAQYARLDEKRKKEKKEFSPPPPPPLPDTVKPINAPVPETTILTPQPLSPPANDLQDHVKTNGLDFADFDNDTSSPFDNMELKTINDMEELAQVLQPTSQWVPPGKLESILNDLTVNEQSETHMEEKNDNIKSETVDQEEVNKQENVKHRSVSAIVQELQRDLERPVMEDRKSWQNSETSDSNSHEILKQEEPVVTNQVSLMNILLDLTEEDKKLARHLSDMGFAVSKAARAIRELGGQDNKKIVEYLLAVQSLEEMGISGEDAEKALALTEFNQEKAKAYYKNLCTLRDLGFPEEEASAALLKCNIDRDRALDFLIT
ncbi:Ubiquitin-associated protein 1 [Habropoda laboriosa]|uniref:Ubiquitin-associated protein 1 n=1 Tax=Habropoda laboriosa TaxID=597456 RepID=A0A0L7QZ40_9HYME|nr:PREDICTED: ubiquitin-associated protein 1 [Habropoda laboriosa]KOC63832.1 Ubiquitin-associated protein 1 [Habropoda laboriosa]